MDINESQSVKTIDKIFASAEKLFVEKGFESTSLRAITNDAGVNLAAVNYHFGGKEALIQAVFKRRFEPFLKDCIREIEAITQTRSYTLEDVIDAAIKPVMRTATLPDNQGPVFARLISRILVGNYDLVRDSIDESLTLRIYDLVGIFQPLMPNYPAEVLIWRIHFMFSLIFHTFAGNDIFKLLMPRAAGSARNPYLLAAQLQPYLLGALTAPLPKKS